MKSTYTHCIFKAFFLQEVYFRFTLFSKRVLLFILFITFAGIETKAQDIFVPEKESPVFVYDEIPVNVLVEGVGTFDLDVIYTNTDLLYINIEDLFRTLKIPCIVGQKGDSLGGFIENENNTYSIEYGKGQLRVGSKVLTPSNGLVKESGALFMESSLFSEAFGIELKFNFRSLSIQLKSKFELPVIKQMRLEKMRSNIAKLKGEEIADTVISRNYHVFKFGTFDYSMATTQVWKGLSNNRFSAGIGAELLFGEADVSINYYDRQKFDNRQLIYLWRWVDNDKKIIKQAQLGKISAQSISFLNAPLVGAVVRNTPTTVRKATGYYTISEFTVPNWTVELYINNVLVDYTTADASGSYRFKVPIVYGYTTIKLKFYGPLGEERTEERNINVPYSVMPVGEFEYGLSTGIVQDSIRSRFGKGEFNYGVTNTFTVGGGLEYLSSIPNRPFIPFAKATLQPFSKLTINAEYAHGVRSRGLLNYYFGKDVMLEIDYTAYVKGQQATRFNALIERKAKLSVPVKYRKFIGYVKFDFTQNVYSEFTYNLANVMLSAHYKQFSANSSAQLNWIDQRNTYITSDIALSYRLPKGYTIRPSVRYNVSEAKFMTCKTELEKSFSRAYFLISYENSFTYSDQLLTVSFKYDLPFARTYISASRNKDNFSTTESVAGSLAFGGGIKYVHKSNNSSVSKGGIKLYPFLDLNQNGIFDPNEPMVKISSVNISGGRAIFNEKDSVVRIPDLNAFTNYFLTFDDNDLENIAWRFKNAKYRVLIDPNQFKRIDIPVISVGEVSGTAYITKNNSLKGIGRIWIKIFDKGSKKIVAETLSESDGYIYYMGLPPGDYIACVDSVQLSNLDFTVDPACKEFTIKTVEDGDIIEGIDFILSSKRFASAGKQIAVPEKKILVPEKITTAPETKASELMNFPIKSTLPGKLTSEQKKTSTSEVSEIPQTVNAKPAKVERLAVNDAKVHANSETTYKVQLLASRKPVIIKDYFSVLQSAIPGLTIEESAGSDGYFRYSAGEFSVMADARALMQEIRRTGWKECFIATYISGKKR